MTQFRFFFPSVSPLRQSPLRQNGELSLPNAHVMMGWLVGWLAAAGGGGGWARRISCFSHNCPSFSLSLGLARAGGSGFGIKLGSARAPVQKSLARKSSLSLSPSAASWLFRFPQKTTMTATTTAIQIPMDGTFARAAAVKFPALLEMSRY